MEFVSHALVAVQPHVVYRMTCWLATCGLRSDVIFRGPFSDLNSRTLAAVQMVISWNRREHLCRLMIFSSFRFVVVWSIGPAIDSHRF